jgi:hypothetical protein
MPISTDNAAKPISTVMDSATNMVTEPSSPLKNLFNIDRFT